MNNIVDTSWVKPPHQIGGLDHLGAQAPCVQIYGDLLPGITNQTNRARYYSFYPWLFTQFEKQGWRSDEKLRPMLRRAECLFTLISLNHGLSEGGPQEIHGAAIVGSDVLNGAIKKIQNGEFIRLSDYASNSDQPTRYFKHKYGALGQYYFGTLRDIGLFTGKSTSELRIPKETGAALASIVSAYVPTDEFISALTEDSVDLALLTTLSPFCSCKLKQASEEISALVNLMLKGWPSLDSGGNPSAEDILASESRSKSLAYILLMANATTEDKAPFDINAFRGTCYTTYSHSGKRLSVPTTLSDQAEKWQVYQRNELLSIALQGLFFAQLKSAELSLRSFSNTSELSKWFWQEGSGREAIHSFLNTNAEEGLTSLANKLPKFESWTDAEHEIQCMQRVVALTQTNGIGKTVILTAIQDSLKILTAILLRPENADGYASYNFPENYLNTKPVNLNFVVSAWKDSIATKPIAEGLALFTQINCLDAHLKVAFRKLHSQSTNTFRFEPRDGIIVIKDIPGAANTSPRFRQAVRILLDLDLLEEKENLLSTTQRGLDFIEAAL